MWPVIIRDNPTEREHADYPRTFRTWDRRFKANVTQDFVAKAFPTSELADNAEYAIFKRKWGYYYAYVGMAFLKGYINCHMLTFVRGVSRTRVTFTANLFIEDPQFLGWCSGCMRCSCDDPANDMYFILYIASHVLSSLCSDLISESEHLQVYVQR